MAKHGMSKPYIMMAILFIIPQHISLSSFNLFVSLAELFILCSELFILCSALSSLS